MIEVLATRDRLGNYIGLKVQGHSSKALGEKGNNLLCAGVSVLTQSLHLYLKANGLLVQEKKEDGFLEILLGKVSEKSNNSFEMTLVGIHSLSKDNPGEIEVFLKEV